MKLGIESLERRVLFSGTWTTVENLQLAPGQTSGSTAMASDTAGNEYAAGVMTDAAGVRHAVIREKPAGGSSWSTIWEGALSGDIADMAVESDGDIYIIPNSAASWTTLAMHRSRGETNFSAIDQVGGNAYGLTVDEATGNVFTVGYASIQIGVSTKGKPTPVYGYAMTVRKQTGGVGTFKTVDTFYDGSSTEGREVTVVPSGPAAGVYVVGSSYAGSWYVRRSPGVGATAGDAGWNTIDTFNYDSAGGGPSQATVVASDAKGNVWVAGTGDVKTLTGGTKRSPTYSLTRYWITRRYAFDSTKGAFGWSTADAFGPAVSNVAYPVADIGFGSDGSVYVVGQARREGDPTLSEHGVVRSFAYRSDTASWQWQTDYFQLSPGCNTTWTGVVIESTGKVIVGGGGIGEDGGYHWLVRELLP